MELLGQQRRQQPDVLLVQVVDGWPIAGSDRLAWGRRWAEVAQRPLPGHDLLDDPLVGAGVEEIADILTSAV